MALAAGCVFGRPGTGGKPRQCAKSPTFAIVVNPVDKLVPEETVEVCAEHLTTFQDRRQGTLYREDAGGQPYGTQAHYVKEG